MKRHLVQCVIGLYAGFCFAQQDPVIMRINGEDISRSEFEYFYAKDTRDANSSKYISPQEYAEVFAINKLKIAEAASLSIDTTQAFRSEMTSYRRRLSKQYLNDDNAADAYARRVYEERKRTGKYGYVEGVQIYIYLPQNTTVYRVNRIEQRMDSIYNAINNGPEVAFTDYVEQFSDDKTTFKIGWLESPEEFEKVVFSLQPGQISRPFFTPQGIHIVKLLNKQQLPPFEEVKDAIKKRYPGKGAKRNSNAEALEKLKNEYGYAENRAGVNELFATGQTSQLLFTIGQESYNGTQFARFRKANGKEVRKSFDAFVTKSLYQHAERNLENQHPAFRLQMQEHKDRLLLSAITNLRTGNTAPTDRAGIQAYFETHEKDYRWELPRYKGIVVHCTNKKTGKKIRKQLRKMPESERVAFIENNLNTPDLVVVKVEQGVFAVGQNDFVDKMVFKVGAYQSLPGYPYTFVLGRKVKGPETYHEVLEAVTADYQKYIEKDWLAALKKKSKVEINQEVLKTVNNRAWN